jgi:hypothetical protein
MNAYRTRKRAYTQDAGVGRIDDTGSDCYHFYVRMRGSDRDNLKKAIEKVAEELGMLPSNPMLLSYLLRKFVAGGNI